jgi:hypothetical protein
MFVRANAAVRLAALLFSAQLVIASLAQAQPASSDRQIQDLAEKLRKQDEKARENRQELEQIRARLNALRYQRDQALGAIRAGQAPPATASGPLPGAPVGERPEEQDSAAQQQLTAALPENINVLARPGAVILTPSAEYTRTASNRLVFRGIAIVPGIQLGLVDANSVAADTAAGVADVRLGIFNRFEAEVRVPYYYRHNTLTTVSQQVVAQQPPVTQVSNLTGNGLGDVELFLRYQINAPARADAPIYIGGLRFKSQTGTGPFDVPFDSSGIATALPTGTGFRALGPTATVIIPSDPAVLFASASYLHSFGENIDRTIGTTHVGQVDPGDSLDMALGFGLALNNRFSVSLGYAHTMVFPTTTELGVTRQISNTLQAGRFTMGWSYQLSDSFTLNNNFEFGVTSDAPNLLITVRVPMGL